MSVGTCKDCPARILWAKTTKGRMMPLDVDTVRGPDGRLRPLEVADGNVEDTGETAWGRDGIRVPVVRVLGPAEAEQASMTPRWRSHFATCPKAAENRRGRRSPARSSGRRPQWDR